jgi:hypothetical protein
MSPWGKIGLLMGIVIVGVVCALELWHWYRGDSLLTRGQLARRLTVGVLLQFAMAMALLGEKFTRGMPPHSQMVYWTVCLVAAIVPLMVALREMGVVSRQYTQRRAELFREIARSTPHDRNPPQPG